MAGTGSDVAGTGARARRLIGFVVGGGLNTGVTYLVYFVLHLKLSYQVAYFIAYVAGILFSYFFNSKVVFKKQMTWTGLLVFPAVYLVQYLISALALAAIVEWAGMDPWFAPLVVSVLTLPLTYIMARFVLQRFNR